MNTPALSRSSRFFRSGFSLVEVVLAVGIMALGVVTILGLLPHGMEITRLTANELAENRIVDGIVSDLQAMDWVTLNDAAGAADVVGNRYFDDQGLSLDEGDPELGAELSYVAHVEIPEMDVLLPSNARLPAINQNLRRVVIKVAATPLQQFDFENPPPAVTVRTVTQLIAKTR
ncbi:MAG: Verru_Chthon cassette protein B [Prosthecobacter sp.]|nr:Verru_Chthon cassette protein B [Prosthecobacter sp.]